MSLIAMLSSVLGKPQAPAPSSGSPLCDAYGWKPEFYLESIAFSVCIAILCEVTMVYYFPGLIDRMWPKGAPELTEKTRYDLAGRALGAIHALLVLFGSLYTTFLDPVIIANPLSGASMGWKLVGSVAGGYFLWDTTECLRKPAMYGVPFLLHGVLCLGAYAMTGWFNTYSWLGSFALLYEASTPFMHLRTWLIAVKQTDTPLFARAQMGFGLTYLFVRIGGGAYFAYTGLSLIWAERCVPMVLGGFASLIIVGTCSLNCYWFSLILQKALKPRKPKPE